MTRSTKPRKPITQPAVATIDQRTLRPADWWNQKKAAALVAARLAMRPAQGAWTFGLGRAEVLAAQGNGITLLLVGVWVVYSAVRRLVHPAAVHGGIVLVVALAGVGVSLASTFVLAR